MSADADPLRAGRGTQLAADVADGARTAMPWLKAAARRFGDWLTSIGWGKFFLLSVLLLIAGGMLNAWLFDAGPAVIVDTTDPRDRVNVVVSVTPEGVRIGPAVPPSPPVAPEAPPPPAGVAAEGSKAEADVKVGKEGVQIITTKDGKRVALKIDSKGVRIEKLAEGNEAAPAGDAGIDSGGAPVVLAPGVLVDPEKAGEAIESARERIESIVQEQVNRQVASTTRVYREQSSDWFMSFLLLLIVTSIIAKVLLGGKRKAETRAQAANATAAEEGLKRQLAEAQLKMMQAQVEPHFLFNTLASVDYLIETDPARASTMQKNLIQYLRAALPQMREGSTTLGKEIALVRSYLEILKVRMEDRLRIAVIAIDPSRRKTGGALLGDRIRMNAINHPGVYMRSLATRETGSEISRALPQIIAVCKAAGFDLIVVETSGIGQGDAAIAPLVDASLYVMTPEFGAATQLEKIDMLDFADFVAINKFDRKGAEDALRDVRKQYQRNHQAFQRAPEEMPVFGTIAARFNDDGVTALYQALLPRLQEKGLKAGPGTLPRVSGTRSSGAAVIVPAARARYLAEIAETMRGYHRHAEEQSRIARERQQLRGAKLLMEGCGKDISAFDDVIAWKDGQLDPRSRKLLDMWPRTVQTYAQDEYKVRIRDKEICTRLVHTTLSGTKIRKVALPKFEDEGEILRWQMKENLPGSFPFTAGVFAFKRENEDPTRMFAGEGDPFRTNRRFKKLSEGMPAVRLSTAFDSVTLYGCDPDERPDIYGKVGNSGVSIATLDDLKVLYSGFDLCAPSTSVSMTINGPAPVILAMFFNTAVDQQLEKFKADNGREPTEDEAEKIREWVLSTVRGTVQADILKEDQGQNTCIFSTEFALKMMGDIQEYFVHHNVKNFYSVSISGYHIAEAGANPVSQLAFTLANGFTYVEAYLARGMHIDDFAPNLSFFFSNGMDPEYSVIGRVARRIWAVAMKSRYGANERSQKLKYHIQTSGRSLHAQEMAFNDIRTTLQALIAVYDNCNSLHTNAYDEAITTPSEESVRRAMAIQLVINKEWGLAKNENPNQGAFIIEELTDLIEEAVFKEFEAISSRGGVLGAMETGYQRGKIQEESLYYEMKKHDGSYPIVGVNTFRNPHGDVIPEKLELARSTEDEKQGQIRRLREFQQRHVTEAPAMIARLKQAAIANENLFAVLMDAVRVCSLGQITQTLFEVGGQYRRNM